MFDSFFFSFVNDFFSSFAQTKNELKTFFFSPKSRFVHGRVLKRKFWKWKSDNPRRYKLKSNETYSGITITSPGFYVPQGRELRLRVKLEDINNKLSSFNYEGFRITNYEMESSAMYGLASMLGHNAVAICLIIANRLNKNANENYRDKVKELIMYVLNKI